MIREETPAGAVIASTVFGRGFELIQRRGSSGDRFIHEDAKGWVTAISDTGTGALVERVRYSAYGETTFLDGAGAVVASRTEESPWLYHGYFLDIASGQYYTVHRYQDPATGRWLSRDALGYIDGLGLYVASLSSPGTWGDPVGLEVEVLVTSSTPAGEAKQEAGEGGQSGSGPHAKIYGGYFGHTFMCCGGDLFSFGDGGAENNMWKCEKDGCEAYKKDIKKPFKGYKLNYSEAKEKALCKRLWARCGKEKEEGEGPGYGLHNTCSTFVAEELQADWGITSPEHFILPSGIAKWLESVGMVTTGGVWEIRHYEAGGKVGSITENPNWHKVLSPTDGKPTGPKTPTVILED